jgi:hypothetical protein
MTITAVGLSYPQAPSPRDRPQEHPPALFAIPVAVPVALATLYREMLTGVQIASIGVE